MASPATIRLVFQKSKIRLQLVALFMCCYFTTSDGKLNSYSAGEVEFCPYFGNRMPEPQPSLKNCTWYKSKSCCMQEEIDVAFADLDPISGSPKCSEYLNYLYCYICAPRQNSFLYINTLTVCEEFCDEILNACSDVLYKGMELGEFYSTGREFCEGRRYNIAKAESHRCFTFDPSSRETKSGVNIQNTVKWSWHIVVIISVLTELLS